MAAVSQNPSVNAIKVYCPVHKLGFSAGLAPAIECPNQNHTIATNFPYDSLWQYCCDCQHYMPAQLDSAADCQACDRAISKRFLCSECQLFSVESSSPGRRKVFSISSTGAPTPACPGCLKPVTGPPKEHQCTDYPHPFVTTRAVCPFCEEVLEPLPAFPCSVSSFLSSLKRSPTSLEFDTESNALSESEAGPYFLIKNSGNTRFPIVIPRSSNLSSKQDYYNTYYELFNCENPTGGEIYILSPAVVEQAGNGWTLREAGFIEIKAEPTLVDTYVTQQLGSACGNCGTLSSPGHVYCKKCGSPLSVETAPTNQKTPPIFKPADEHLPNDSWRAPVTTGEISSVPPSPSYPWKPIVGVVGGIASIGIIITIIAVLSANANSVEKKLDKAIVAGNFFPPISDNAYDLYLQLKNSGASEEKLRPYRDRILPGLSDRPLQMIRDFMVAGSDDPPISDWQAVAQKLRWSLDLNPSDKTLLSRSLYAQGRVAYLSKDENQALSIWSRAAEADKSWPLPENGIGLIHFANKNYAAARTHYQLASQRDPNWPYPYNNIGTSYYMEKNYSEAKGFYQKAAQLAPSWARPHSWLGDIAMKEQDYQTAFSEFSLVVDANATGTKNMDLDKIRRQLEFARQHLIQYDD